MKLWNYIVIMITMVVFLNLLGLGGFGEQGMLTELNITVNTSNSANPISQDSGSSNFYSLIFVAGLALAATTTGFAIITALATQSSLDWKIVALGPILWITGIFVISGWNIMQLAIQGGEGWLVAVVGTIFIPLTLGFIMSTIEWFAGGDN